MRTRRFSSKSGTSPLTIACAEPFDDGRLADAGFADEDGVVLGAAAEDLDDALDLALAADDGIELVLGGPTR